MSGGAVMQDNNGNFLKVNADGTGNVQVVGSYVEYIAVSNDTINASTTKYYVVDLVSQFGFAPKAWGIAIDVTNAASSPVTVKTYSIPKNISPAGASTVMDTLFNAVNIATGYPLQKQSSSIAPKISIEVTAGATQLTGVKVIVWAFKGVS